MEASDDGIVANTGSSFNTPPEATITIWFRSRHYAQAISAIVPMAIAKHVWDKLDKQFEMVSARP